MLEFEADMAALHEARLPVSASRITHLTKLALKDQRQYKLVVHAIERFAAKCKPEYKLVGLYVIDSILRSKKDVYLARFDEKLDGIFAHLLRGKVADTDKEKMKKVVDIWIKNGVFESNRASVIAKTFFSDGAKDQASRGVDASDFQNQSSGDSPSDLNNDDAASTAAANAAESMDAPKPATEKLPADPHNFDYGDEDDSTQQLPLPSSSPASIAPERDPRLAFLPTLSATPMGSLTNISCLSGISAISTVRMSTSAMIPLRSSSASAQPHHTHTQGVPSALSSLPANMELASLAASVQGIAQIQGIASTALKAHELANSNSTDETTQPGDLDTLKRPIHDVVAAHDATEFERMHKKR